MQIRIIMGYYHKNIIISVCLKFFNNLIVKIKLTPKPVFKIF